MPQSATRPTTGSCRMASNDFGLLPTQGGVPQRRALLTRRAVAGLAPPPRAGLRWSKLRARAELLPAGGDPAAAADRALAAAAAATARSAARRAASRAAACR